MNILELGAIGELVGGVAVVGSLLYVGLQVRQSNRLARVQAHQETARVSTELAMQLDRESIELMLQGARDSESLSEVDRALYVLKLTAAGNYYETLFYARERGEVDDDLWASRLRRMQGTFALFLPLWSTQKDAFGQRFVAFVDTEVIPKLDRENVFLPEEIRAPDGA